jgi:hypothetical protein
MVMEKEHMVDGDVVVDDGDEDGDKIPLSDGEIRTNVTLERKIVVVAALHFTNRSVLLGG